MRVKSSGQVSCDHVVPERSADQFKDFAVNVFVPRLTSRFDMQIFFYRDGAVFLNEHRRTLGFNNAHYVTSGEFPARKRATVGHRL